MSHRPLIRQTETTGGWNTFTHTHKGNATLMIQGRGFYSDSTPPIHDRINQTVYFDLLKRVNDLESRFVDLTKKLQDVMPQEITIREFSRKEAKKEIRQYFKDHHGENIDPSDIFENLGIDIELAIELCDELEREGRVRAV